MYLVPPTTRRNASETEDDSDRQPISADQAKWRDLRHYRHIARGSEAMINSAAQIRADAADLDDKISALHQETEETRAEIAKLDDAREGLRRSRERMLDVARMADDAMREIQALEKDRS